MGLCGNKINQTCGSTTYSSCTNFEGTPNIQSVLYEETCLDQEVVDQDQYNQLGEIKNQIDLTELGESCLVYVLEEGKVVVKNVLAKFEEEICTLKTKINMLETESICNKNIASCDFDFGNLVDACGNQPLTLARTIQLILDTLNTP